MNMQEIRDLFTNTNAVETVVNLNALVLDAGTQQRTKIDKGTVDEYCEAMLAGQAAKFPPLWVMCLSEPAKLADGSTLEMGAMVLVDGFHRSMGACSAKLETFQAIIEHGTLQDAIYASMGANSRHGLKLGAKDYQKAIKQLYTLDAGWREHGKKQEIALLFGCSEKTVQRATKAFDEWVKAEAFKMFEAGATDEDVATFAVISVKTAAIWRAEWEASKEEKPEPKGSDDNPAGDDNDAVKGNPLNMTLEQIIKLKDTAIKAIALQLLMDSIKADQGQQGAAQDEPQGDDKAPWDEPEAEQVEGDDAAHIAALVKAWKGQDWSVVLGVSLEKLLTYANPKNQLKRAYAKALKDCHPDHYGDNEACEILKDANNAALAALKANGVA